MLGCWQIFFLCGFCASDISNNRYFCCIDSSQLEHIAVYPSQCTLSAYFVTCVKSAANQGNKVLVGTLMHVQGSKKTFTI